MAARFSAQLVELGVYAVSFSYPVVPRGTARIRTQMSAAHSTQDVDFAVERFRQAREDQPSWTDAAGERA
jgi:glycine C-acetyltransferase